jgi:hypothetical protein
MAAHAILGYKLLLGNKMILTDYLTKGAGRSDRFSLMESHGVKGYSREILG